jgi:hypothetical protein
MDGTVIESAGLVFSAWEVLLSLFVGRLSLRSISPFLLLFILLGSCSSSVSMISECSLSLVIIGCYLILLLVRAYARVEV